MHKHNTTTFFTSAKSKHICAIILAFLKMSQFSLSFYVQI